MFGVNVLDELASDFTLAGFFSRASGESDWLAPCNWRYSSFDEIFVLLVVGTEEGGLESLSNLLMPPIFHKNARIS